MSLTTSIAYWTRGGPGLPNAFNWKARAKFGPSIIEDGQSKLALGQALSLRTIGGFGANGGTMLPLSNRRHGGAYCLAKRNQGEWTSEEIATLKEMYGLMSIRELAGRLKRSPKSVRHKAMREGLTL